MSTLTIEASRIIRADADMLYDVISDYEVGHQAILPRPVFQEMTILSGGRGAGTRIKLHVKMFGQSYYYDQIVEEPEPGRVLVERDINTGQWSSFILEPLGDGQTRVTIRSEMPISSGIKGFLERISQPSIVGKLYKQELENLDNYVRQNATLPQQA